LYKKYTDNNNNNNNNNNDDDDDDDDDEGEIKCHLQITKLTLWS
jgi:hypothetical protein